MTRKQRLRCSTRLVPSRSCTHGCACRLLSAGGTCSRSSGVLEFYLWDLLPAVYISYPELFDENPVTIRSTVADLESGMLVRAGEGEGTIINMPTQILDRKRFMAILYEAWARVVYE